MRVSYRLTSFALMLLLSACSATHRPAPVSDISLKAPSYNPISTPKTYLVRKGDSLFSIAFLHGLDHQEIARFNGLSSPYTILPGQTLHLLEAAPLLTHGQSNQTKQVAKIKLNQPVDPPSTQAYGDPKREQKIANPTRSEYAGNVLKWQWPAQGKVINKFSPNEQGNKGIDITNRIATPIRAAADGKVVYTGNALRGYGELVIIKHSDDFLTAYAHNNEILVKEQQWIKAGDKIATMGSSDSDRVKLHFEVRLKGKSVNPLHYLPKK